MTLRRHQPLLLFFAYAVLANLAIAIVTRLHPDPRVTAATCFDLLISIPAVYYFLAIHRRGGHSITILPVLLAGLLRVSLLLSWKAGVGIACEAALIGFVLYRKPKLLMSEFRLLRYGLFSWGAKPDVPAGACVVSIHKDTGILGLFGIFALVSVMEAAAMHLAIQRWSPTAAWILTGLSLYGAFMLVAIARSVVLLPILVTGDEVVLRFGILREARIARTNIAAIRPAAIGEKSDVSFTAGGDAKYVIELHEPVIVENLYGRRKSALRIATAAIKDLT